MDEKKLKRKWYWTFLLIIIFILLSPILAIGFLLMWVTWLVSFPFLYPRYKKSSYPAKYNEAYNNWLDFKIYDVLKKNQIKFERYKLHKETDDWVYYLNDEEIVYVLIEEEIWNIEDKWFSEYTQYLENNEEADLFESIGILLNSIDLKKPYKLVIDRSSMEHFKKDDIRLFDADSRLIEYKAFLRIIKKNQLRILNLLNQKAENIVHFCNESLVNDYLPNKEVITTIRREFENIIISIRDESKVPVLNKNRLLTSTKIMIDSANYDYDNELFDLIRDFQKQVEYADETFINIVT